MARLELSASAVEHNLLRCVQVLRASSAGEARLIAVLKDNAYGHGAALVAGICRDFGISMCAVKNEREAAELRRFFSDILILSQPGRFARGGMGIYAVNDLDDLRYLRSQRVMLKIDSGMSRSGLRCGQIRSAVAAAKAASCTLLGAFTHFSSTGHIAAQQAVYVAAAREYLAAAREAGMLCAEADVLARLRCGTAASAAAGQPAAQNLPYINEGAFSAAALEDAAGAPAQTPTPSENPLFSQIPAAEACEIPTPRQNPLFLQKPVQTPTPRQNPLFSQIPAAEACEIPTPRQNPLFSQIPAAGCFAPADAGAAELADVPGAFFHSAASFGLFAGAAALDGAARVGLALYGYAHPSLRPAGRLIAERISTRELAASDSVGYDEVFRASEAMIASNYDLGYADGLAFYDGSWPLELGGAQVLGKFSMDSLSAATDAPEICIYEDAAAYARKFGISVYEAIVRLAAGVPRVVVR